MEILVIRFSSLGDVVLAIGALRAIGQAHPDAKLAFATKPNYRMLTENLDVSVAVPGLDPERLLSSAHAAFKDRSFDHIVDLHGSLRSRLLSRSLRAKQRLRVAKHTAERRAMVKEKAGLDKPLSVLHACKEALHPLGITDDIQPALFLSPDDSQRVTELRGASTATIGIGWGARWPTKAVPARTWAALFAELGSDAYDHVRIFGMDDDRASIDELVRSEEWSDMDINIECGHTIRDAMIRIAACDLFVSSDSGLMHVAAALGVSTIGLFGPTHPSLGFAPVGKDASSFHAGTWCSPCHRHGAAPCFRNHRHCFDELDIPAIAESARRSLAQPWSLPHA